MPAALRRGGRAPTGARRPPPCRGRRRAGGRAPAAERRRPRSLLEERAERERLAVRRRRTRAGERALRRQLLCGGDECIGSVVDVGRVDQRPAAGDDDNGRRSHAARRCARRAACRRGPRWRAKRSHRHGERRHRPPRARRARPPLSTPNPASGRYLEVISAALHRRRRLASTRRRPTVRRRRRVAPRLGSPAGRDDRLRAADIDLAELLARADDADPRGAVDERVTSGRSGRNGVRVADVGEHLLARERVAPVALERHAPRAPAPRARRSSAARAAPSRP